MILTFTNIFFLKKQNLIHYLINYFKFKFLSIINIFLNFPQHHRPVKK
jgi:hypothetical protein